MARWHFAAVAALGAFAQSNTAVNAACTQITNVCQLQNINKNLSDFYCLANDINASASAIHACGGTPPFKPIGDPFSGRFDGRDFLVYGLVVQGSGGADSYDGLFTGNSGTIKNVRIRAFVSKPLTDPTSSLGGIIAGYNFGTITSVNTSGKVTAPMAGGIVGQNFGMIEYSASNSSVTGIAAGGLVGENTGTSWSIGTISHSYFLNGLVTGVSQYSSVGGIAGWGTSSGSQMQYPSIIIESFSTGSVRGFGYRIGGLSGTNFGNISSSYATGPVTAGLLGEAGVDAGGAVAFNPGTINTSFVVGRVKSAGQTGGLVPGNFNTLNVRHSYWDVQTTGQMTSNGGTPRTTLQLKSAPPLAFGKKAGWGFSTGTYPYLLFLEQKMHVVTGGYVYLPVGQRDPSQYSNSILASFANEACKAAVYAMLGRSIGQNFPNQMYASSNPDAVLQNVPIGQFWLNDTVGAYLGPLRGLVSLSSKITIPSRVEISDSNVIGALKTGNPVVIHGTVKGNAAGHWMLATDFLTDSNGRVIRLLANDPWTGGQVQINPVNKAIMSGPPGFFKTFRLDGYQVVTIKR